MAAASLQKGRVIRAPQREPVGQAEPGQVVELKRSSGRTRVRSLVFMGQSVGHVDRRQRAKCLLQAVRRAVMKGKRLDDGIRQPPKPQEIRAYLRMGAPEYFVLHLPERQPLILGQRQHCTVGFWQVGREHQLTTVM